MKKIFLTTAISILMVWASGQSITQVLLSISKPETFCFSADGNVFVYVSADGRLMEWGTPYQEGRMAYFPGKLEPYIGRVEYYSQADNPSFIGKPKYIGSIAITYYSSYENENFAGKVKSIGTAILDYYTAFENDAFKGKLKNVGSTAISYYGNFDNPALKGRLSAIGNTIINYYSSFDDVAYRGKIKSIGSVNFTYYSSFEQKEYRGIMKTGNYKNLVNGINFIVWN